MPGRGSPPCSRMDGTTLLWRLAGSRLALAAGTSRRLALGTSAPLVCLSKYENHTGDSGQKGVDGMIAVLQATIDTLQGQLEVKDRQIEQ